MLHKSVIKYIQSLHQKKFRNLYGAYLAEGPKIVEEVIRTNAASLEYIVALPEWLEPHAAQVGGRTGLPADRILAATDVELERVSALTTPNQVLAVLKIDTGPLPPVLPGAWCLVLDGLQDPGNLGTMLRIADWFGIGHVVCSPDSAEVHNPKVIQASMGSFLRVVTHYEELGPWLAGYAGPVYAATLDGEPLSNLSGGQARPKPGIILIGNESRGIREGLPDGAVRLTIPRLGQAESLNAAVAAGILLSQLCGARDAGLP